MVYKSNQQVVWLIVIGCKVLNNWDIMCWEIWWGMGGEILLVNIVLLLLWGVIVDTAIFSIDNR